MSDLIVDVLRDYPAVVDADQRELAVTVRETRMKAAERLAKTLPAIYADAVVDHSAVLEWVRKVADAAAGARRAPWLPPMVSTGPSLLLLGPVGTGKTHQTWGAVRALALSGLSVTWQVTTAADLYARMRPRHGVDAETVFERYATAGVLVLDDLGAAKPSEWTEEVNYRLINHRYERAMPTLFTSNLLIQKLADRLGDRVVSRLNEMAYTATVGGGDRRKAGPRSTPLPPASPADEPAADAEGVPMPDDVREQIAAIVGRNRVPAGRTHADPNQHAAFRDNARDQLDRTRPADIPEETE